MQELQENYDRLKANQEVVTADRETEEESDFEIQDPFGSHSAMELGSPRQTAIGGPPVTLPGLFAAQPFENTNNLNLANPKIRDQNPQEENGNTKREAKTTTTPARGDDESSESECEITN